MAIISKIFSLSGTKTDNKKASVALPAVSERITGIEEAKDNFTKFGL